MSSMDPSISPESHAHPQLPSTASPPMTQSPAPATMKDTAEDFHEEEDRLDYASLDIHSMLLPPVACPEKILICMDPCIETAG